VCLGACSTQTETFNRSSREVATTSARSFKFVTSPAILIFSETRDWRHEEGIAGATLAIIKIANKMGFNYFTTEHSGVFNDADLQRFTVVVFNNMSGNALNAKEKAAFIKWQAKGNGAVLVHSAGDSSHHGWKYYQDKLIGAKFISHTMAPQFQQARIQVLAPNHPVMQGLPKSFLATDEWYTFDAPPNENFTMLAGLDEGSYSPTNTVYGERSDLRMGPKPRDHPIIWASCIGTKNARTVFTAMGHQYQSYEAKENLQILKNSLQWVAKITDPRSAACLKPPA